MQALPSLLRQEIADMGYRIIDFIESHEPAGEVRYGGADSRGEFWTFGTCPSCGHRSEAGSGTPDRVRVRPTWKGGKAWWRCHRCQASGDGIDLLVKGYGFGSVQEARSYLGLVQNTGGSRHLGGTQNARINTSQPIVLPTPASPNIDVDKWRSFVERFLADCMKETSLPYSGRKAFEERGLPVGFDAGGTLAWNNHVRFVERSELGIAGTGKVRIPRGLVIVCRRCSGMLPVSLSVRRDGFTEDIARYGKLWEFGNGMRSRPYISDGLTGLPVILTESYLDAVAVRYAVGTDVICAGLGGAEKMPDADLAEYIEAAPMCWFWMDADEAGQKAFERMQSIWPKVLPLRLKDGCGKDATGMVRLGLEHPEWHVPTIGQWLTKAGVVGAIEDWASRTGIPKMLNGLVRVQTLPPYLGI